jgi:hypothetical protein
MFSDPVHDLIDPTSRRELLWRRFATCAGCALVGIAVVMLLVAVLTFLHPVLP